MSGFLLLLSACVGAPMLKDPPRPNCEVVHATCVSTVERGSIELQSTFVTSDPSAPSDLERGQRFTVRYVKHGARHSGHPGGLDLDAFQPDDRSYWVVIKKKDGSIEAIDRYGALTKDLLPNPYTLIHLLTEKEKVQFPTTTLPDETTTRELAHVIRRGLRLKSREERAEFIRQESDTKNKYVKEYLDWLGKRDKK